MQRGDYVYQAGWEDPDLYVVIWSDEDRSGKVWVESVSSDEEKLVYAEEWLVYDA